LAISGVSVSLLAHSILVLCHEFWRFYDKLPLPGGKSATSSGKWTGEHLGFDPKNPAHPLVQMQSSGMAFIGSGIAALAVVHVLDAFGEGAKQEAFGYAADKATGITSFISWIVKKFTLVANLIAVPLILVGLAKAVFLFPSCRSLNG
jgi:hypothetical protein